MPGQEFFYAVLFSAVGLFGFGGLMAARQRQLRWNVADAANLRIGLEYGLCAAVFALLPFPLYYLLGVSVTIWHLSSFLLVCFMLVESIRIFYNIQALRMRWPLAMIAFLVFSAIFLTIELINTLWWGSLGVYAGGLLWILGVAGVQLVAFVCYARPPFAARYGSQPGRYAVRGFLTDRVHTDRLRSDHAAGYPNSPANGNAHTYRDPIQHAGRQQHADRNPVNRARVTHRGPVTDGFVRSDENAFWG